MPLRRAAMDHNAAAFACTSKTARNSMHRLPAWKKEEAQTTQDSDESKQNGNRHFAPVVNIDAASFTQTRYKRLFDPPKLESLDLNS